MSFLKNLRGATTYASPTSQEYRDNYDRTFGKKTVGVCPACGEGGKEQIETMTEHGPIRIVACEKCCPDGQARHKEADSV